MIEVYDDVLPGWLLHRIKYNVENLPMRITNTATSYDQNISLGKIIEMREDDVSIEGSIYETAIFESLFTSALGVLNEAKIEGINHISRIRPAIIFRDIEQRPNGPHVDDAFRPHKVGLLYLNDTDGDTIIYENKFDYSFDSSKVEDKQNLSTHYLNNVIGGEGNLIIKKRVTPKENRLVVFDGAHYHSSSTPSITQLRLAINYNFLM